ncbi:MAG: glycosyltransferase [Candidatus Methanomethylophilaceae archaeon]
MRDDAASVLMLRSHYPDARTGKVKRVLEDVTDVHLHAWCRGHTETGPDGSLSLFRFPLPRQSPLVVLLLPLFQISIALQILRRRPRVLHAVDLDTMLTACILAKVTGASTVYEIYDYYPDMVSADRIGSRIRPLLVRLDSFLVRSADQVIIVDDNRREQIPSLPDYALAIYNSPALNDGDEARPSHRRPFRVFYGGFVSRERGIDALCQAVSGLDGVELEVYGDCDPDYRRELQGRFGKLDNIHLCLRYVDHAEIVRRTMDSQLVPVLYDSSVRNNRYSSPNKFFEALALGIPVMSYPDCSVDEKVRRWGCGVVVPEGDVASIRETLSTLRDDPLLWKGMSRNARAAHDSDFSWELMKRRLRKMYEELLGK